MNVAKTSTPSPAWWEAWSVIFVVAASVGCVVASTGIATITGLGRWPVWAASQSFPYVGAVPTSVITANAMTALISTLVAMVLLRWIAGARLSVARAVLMAVALAAGAGAMAWSMLLAQAVGGVQLPVPDPVFFMVPMVVVALAQPTGPHGRLGLLAATLAAEIPSLTVVRLYAVDTGALSITLQTILLQFAMTALLGLLAAAPVFAVRGPRLRTRAAIGPVTI
jgi:hypothetical protein